ncbi:unnamed protein product, partial [Durusdinium trenchii]
FGSAGRRSGQSSPLGSSIHHEPGTGLLRTERQGSAAGATQVREAEVRWCSSRQMARMGQEGLHARRRIRWRLLVKLRPPPQILARLRPNQQVRRSFDCLKRPRPSRESPAQGFEDLEGGPFAGRLENSKKKRNQAFKEISLKSDKNARIQRLNNRRKQMYKGQEDED